MCIYCLLYIYRWLYSLDNRLCILGHRRVYIYQMVEALVVWRQAAKVLQRGQTVGYKL